MKNREQVRAAILERGGIFPVQPLCSPPAASPTAAGVQQISAFCSQQRSAFILFSGSPEKEVSHGNRRALPAAPPAGPAPRPARINVPDVPATLLCGDAGAAGEDTLPTNRAKASCCSKSYFSQHLGRGGGRGGASAAFGLISFTWWKCPFCRTGA